MARAPGTGHRNRFEQCFFEANSGGQIKSITEFRPPQGDGRGSPGQLDGDRLARTGYGCPRGAYLARIQEYAGPFHRRAPISAVMVSAVWSVRLASVFHHYPSTLSNTGAGAAGNTLNSSAHQHSEAPVQHRNIGNSGGVCVHQRSQTYEHPSPTQNCLFHMEIAGQRIAFTD